MSESERPEVSHIYQPDTASGGFVMKVAEEGQPTVDGRIFEKGAITWRKPPVPLMFIRSNDPSGRGGHKTSSAVGTITDIWRETNEEGFATIYSRGYFAADDEGQAAKALIEEGVISGVSADVAGAVVEELEATDDESGGLNIRKRITAGEIVAVTCLPIPAFDDMKISVTAAATPEGWKPSKKLFQTPNFTEPTPLTLSADNSHVFGHVALWGTCHVGRQDKCVTPPRSRGGYQYFNVGHVMTEEGEIATVGRLTAGIGHANLAFSAQAAADHYAGSNDPGHYDNTAYAAAYVHAGEDEHGIWISGAVAPTATPEQIAVLRAASVSGDWRAINGALEMVGVLAVNSPGFPIPRAKAGIVAGAQISLIASNTGACKCKESDEDCDCDKSDSYPEKQVDNSYSTEITEETQIVEGETVEDLENELALLDIQVLYPEIT